MLSSSISSAPIIGIDGNRTVRQIAGPNGRASFLQAQFDFDVNFPAFEMRCHRSFVIVFNGKATPRHLHTAEADGKPTAVVCFACLADGHYDPAPHGIFARVGSLHQWPIGVGKPYLSLDRKSDV